jgi:hypothetical protein
MSIRLKPAIVFSALLAGLLMLFVVARSPSVPSSLSSFTTSSRPKPGSQSSTYGAGVDPLLEQRLAHAEKLWQQAVEDRKPMADHMGNEGDFPDEYVSPYNVWDFARPSFFCPHDLERVGTLGDGGKVVCGMTRYERESPGPSTNENPAPELIMYSFGVFGDSSFEADMLRRTNAHIWGYDYSVGQWAHHITEDQYSRAHFSKMGISNVTDLASDPPMISVQDLMKQNGHTYVDIIKMDIEGAEFDVMTSLIEHTIAQGQDTLPFGQLLVEIHFMVEPSAFSQPRSLAAWMEWWTSLEKMGLRPVNNEDNWIGDEVYGKPRFIEYTLINGQDKARNRLLWA